MIEKIIDEVCRCEGKNESHGMQRLGGDLMAIEYNRKNDEVYMVCDICGRDAEDELYQDDETGEMYCEECLFKRFKRIDYDTACEIAEEEEEARREEAEEMARDALYDRMEEEGKCISKGLTY